MTPPPLQGLLPARATGVLILAATLRARGRHGPPSLNEILKAQEAFNPVERIEGSLAAGVVLLCDHASNAFPPGYGALGLTREALQRHIAYDIGAAAVTRRLAALLDAPALHDDIFAAAD